MCFVTLLLVSVSIIVIIIKASYQYCCLLSMCVTHKYVLTWLGILLGSLYIYLSILAPLGGSGFLDDAKLQ